MSWCFGAIGTPARVAAALEAHREYSHESQAEFEEAKPHLVALLRLNFNEPPCAIRLEASGHAARQAGVKIYGSVQVRIEPLGMQMV
jgi:hypothetical protein